jgi:hypothetical protein
MRMNVGYTLTGFSHDLGFRVFTFERIVDHVRTAYVVRADLALARKHCVPIQELPLLCRTLLERRREGDSARLYTFGEAEMCEYENVRAARRAAEMEKRRPMPRKSAEQ